MSKVTQAEANYRRGDPINSCGSCAFFQGNITNRCTKVAGEISHYGISDVFQPDQDNPFGRSLNPQEVQAIKQIAASAAARAGQGGGPTQGQQPMPPPGGRPMPPQQQAAPPRPFFQ